MVQVGAATVQPRSGFDRPVVLRGMGEHTLHDEFIGPRFFVHVAALEMHPLDTENRTEELAATHGIGYCNITKCCTRVCPENITITDNAIIPLKERVIDDFYDPIRKLFRIFRPKET